MIPHVESRQQSPRIFQFGPFVLDTGRAQLLAGGEEVQLTPKALAVLRLLIERRPNVVDKDTIAELVWGGAASDASLTMAMAEIRKALGDSAANPLYIRTAHRLGYAFCGHVTEGGDSRGDARFFLMIGDKRIPLRDRETIAGRDEGCGVLLDEPSVSRRHARFVVDGDTVSVEDLQSTNGTLVNGRKKAGAVPLRAGDTIKIGSVKARLDAPHVTRSGKTVRLPGR